MSKTYLTVDLEEWYQGLPSTSARPESWKSYESRIRANTDWLLRVLDSRKVKATFFVVGQVAREHPSLIAEISAQGHELGLHGDLHRRVDSMSPSQFRDDLKRNLDALARATSQQPKGFRAPYFSITWNMSWVYEVLAELDLEYDSSLFPVKTPLYGDPSAPAQPVVHANTLGRLRVYPISACPLAGFNIPFSGGFYFRSLPYQAFRILARRVLSLSRPLVFYCHPWEFDPDLPRPSSVTMAERVSLYAYLQGTSEKFLRFLEEFRPAPLGGCPVEGDEARRSRVGEPHPPHEIAIPRLPRIRLHPDQREITIHLMAPNERDAWRSYVHSHPRAGPMHLVEWYDVLDTASSVTPLYLMAAVGGKVAGVLPLYLSESLFTGRHVASLQGAFLADTDLVAAKLEAEAINVSFSRKAKYLLLRERSNILQPPDAAHQAVRSVIDLRQGAEALWGRLSSNTRRKVRKALKNGYTVETTGAWTDEFYAVYSKRMHQLGTPVETKKFFDSIAVHLGKETVFFSLLHGRRVVGGMLALVFNDALWSIYAAVDSVHMRSYANYRLYWSSIEHACARGLSRFDLGRSVVESGTHKFKKQWASRDQLVENAYFSIRDINLDKINLHRESSRKQKAWRRLPLPVANIIGPVLRRQLPFG